MVISFFPASVVSRVFNQPILFFTRVHKAYIHTYEDRSLKVEIFASLEKA